MRKAKQCRGPGGKCCFVRRIVRRLIKKPRTSILTPSARRGAGLHLPSTLKLFPRLGQPFSLENDFEIGVAILAQRLGGVDLPRIIELVEDEMRTGTAGSKRTTAEGLRIRETRLRSLRALSTTEIGREEFPSPSRRPSSS